MCPQPSAPLDEPTGPRPPETPAWLVSEIVSHARIQLQKGWSPQDVSRNLQKRYGLLEVSARTVVAELLARRQGRGANEAALTTTFLQSLGIAPEQGAVIARHVLATGLALDDDATAFALVFEPSRAPVVDDPPAMAEPAQAAPAAAARMSRVTGPIQMRINLLRRD